MDRSDSGRGRRAGERAAWPGRVIPLADEGKDELRSRTTPEERLAMMWPLALDAWASSGRPLPTYERSQAPGRLIRPDG